MLARSICQEQLDNKGVTASLYKCLHISIRHPSYGKLFSTTDWVDAVDSAPYQNLDKPLISNGEMPRILIIGATGYVGSALAGELLRSGGYTVYGLARNPNKAKQLAAKEIILVTGSVSGTASYLSSLRLLESTSWLTTLPRMMVQTKS